MHTCIHVRYSCIHARWLCIHAGIVCIHVFLIMYTCKIIMYTWRIIVFMQDNYVYMQYNYVYMPDNSVYMPDNSVYMYTYLLLLISMLWHRQSIFKSKGDKLSSSAECRIWTWGLRHQIASRLNAQWQTDGAIEDLYITVVKRTRVPAGSLVKMATDAASLRPGLCELWRPHNLQRDHTSCADTKKYK